jgi:hypothetical protein
METSLETLKLVDCVVKGSAPSVRFGKLRKLVLLGGRIDDLRGWFDLLSESPITKFALQTHHLTSEMIDSIKTHCEITNFDTIKEYEQSEKEK